MLACVQRHVDAGGGRQLPRPHAGRGDDVGRSDGAGLGFDAGDPAPGLGDAQDLGVLENPDAAVSRPFRQRHGHVSGVGLAVGGNEDAAKHVIDGDQWIKLLAFLRPDDVDPKPEHLGHVGAALQVFQAALGGGDGKRAVLLVARSLAGFVLKAQIKLGRVLGQLGHVLVVAELPDQPGGVPGRTRGQLLAFQQNYVGPADLSQVVGDGASDDAAADDDGLGFPGRAFGQRVCLRILR